VCCCLASPPARTLCVTSGSLHHAGRSRKPVWSVHASKSTGLLYFYNRLTGQTQVRRSVLPAAHTHARTLESQGLTDMRV
jgi:hypothetical protein